MFAEVDAHAFESIGGEEGDEAGVFFFELVGDVLEGLAHGVLDHFFFGLFGLLEALVEVAEDFSHEGSRTVLQLLPHFGYSFLV